MNKIKLGNFIKKLRNTVGMSQEKLSLEFEKRNLIVSKKAISDWENGKTIPEIDKLNELANILNVSIDEILDGEIKKEIDFSKKYFISDPQWHLNFDPHITFGIRQNQSIEIIKKFNNLLKKIAQEIDLTSCEEKEFKFLFENFFTLSDYIPDHFQVEMKEENPYLNFKFFIKLYLPKLKDLSLKEKIWEMKKFILPGSEINFSLNNFSDEINQDIDKRFKTLEFWEKDMILTSIQISNPTIDHSSYGSKNLKAHEQKIGHAYDKEQDIKNIIKYLINNGACINKHYLRFIKQTKERKRIIDRLEELYFLCKKPLEKFYVNDEGKKIYYRVENNRKNRFLHDYYYDFSLYFDYPTEELFHLINDNEKIPDFMIINAAQKKKINICQDIKYIKSDLPMESILKKWNEFKLKEKEIAQGLVEMENLIQKLNNGEKYEFVTHDKIIGGDNLHELLNYNYYWNRCVSRAELYRQRLVKETNELLKNIDHMALEEIRKTFFKMEVIEDESY